MDRDAEKIAQLKKEALRMGVSIIESMQADLSHPLPAEFARKI